MDLIEGAFWHKPRPNRPVPSFLATTRLDTARNRTVANTTHLQLYVFVNLSLWEWRELSTISSAQRTETGWVQKTVNLWVMQYLGNSVLLGKCSSWGMLYLVLTHDCGMQRSRWISWLWVLRGWTSWGWQSERRTRVKASWQTATWQNIVCESMFPSGYFRFCSPYTRYGHGYMVFQIQSGK